MVAQRRRAGRRKRTVRREGAKKHSVKGAEARLQERKSKSIEIPRPLSNRTGNSEPPRNGVKPLMPPNQEKLEELSQRVDKKRKPPSIRIVSGSFTLILAFICLVFGGYFWNWSWTGFQGNTMWEWLQLLILPVALGTSAIWIKYMHVTLVTKVLLSLVLASLVIFIILSYIFHWEWTGFTDKALWDWLSLVLLPATIQCTSIWFNWSESHSAPLVHSEQVS